MVKKVNYKNISIGKTFIHLAIVAVILNILFSILTMAGIIEKYFESGAIISLWLTLLFLIVGIYLILNEVVKKL